MKGAPKVKEVRYTRRDMQAEFPDDAAALDWLWRFLYADAKGRCYCVICKKATKHHRVKSRPSYSCQDCGHHVHPMAGTIFEHSSTPLRLWFDAIYLMSSTRCGVSAKHLQRELGVTYKTAWRMFRQIRALLKENVALGGSVEMDETYVGGRQRGHGGRSTLKKSVVFGMVERGGKVSAKVVAGARKLDLIPHVEARVLPATMIYTDDLPTYRNLPTFKNLKNKGYQHRRIHHLAHVYVDGDVHTNTIEGFWSLLKRGISGAHHSVSKKYLQTYLDEFCFRYNHRKDSRPMFRAFLENVRTASALASSTPS
jgi:transposase-like protein